MNNNTPHKPRKSRHAKRHAAEQTEPFGFDELGDEITGISQ